MAKQYFVTYAVKAYCNELYFRFLCFADDPAQIKDFIRIENNVRRATYQPHMFRVKIYTKEPVYWGLRTACKYDGIDLSDRGYRDDRE